MKRLPALNMQILRMIDQNARSDWTSSLVRDTLDYRFKLPYPYNPEDAPKTPSASRVRSVLKDLTDLELIKCTVNQTGKGFLKEHIYERIIPEPLKIEYRDADGKWGLPVLLFVGACCYLMGWAL